MHTTAKVDLVLSNPVTEFEKGSFSDLEIKWNGQLRKYSSVMVNEVHIS